ncbi:MAG: amino acid adenylation domain-containing protein [Microcoleus sp.]
MRQWLDTTVERILSWKPDRVLEIGCGTGMLLFQIAPKCSYYLGTDFSSQVLSYVEQQLEKLDGNWSQVSLSQRTADNFEGIEPASFDTVIINSVIELFPSINYLSDVLKKAILAVKKEGIIFIGDIRNFSLLEAFYAKLELDKASDLLSIKELQQYIFDSMGKEDQLLLSPDFFIALKQHFPSISHVQIQLKRDRYHNHNEISKFRYDVILHIEKQVSPTAEFQWLDWQKNELTVSAVLDLLKETKPEFLGIKNIPNPRLSQEIKLLDLLHSETKLTTVGELRAALQGFENDGIEPEDWWTLGAEFSQNVYINWSEVKGCYNVVFQLGEKLFDHSLDNIQIKPWLSYGNNPLQSKIVGNLEQKLRTDLKKSLPDYMMPTAFVILDQMPLTPSGKVDRRGLKAPEKHRPELSTVLVIPRTDNEKLIAKIWQELLQIDLVGIHDNFFELGGHSLVATQLTSRLRENFQVEIPLRVIFESPTIAELDQALSQLLLLKKGLNIYPLKHVTKDLEQIPLSFQQERLWFVDQLEGANATYNIPLAISLTGNLKINVLEKALSEIVQRHEVLRTSFPTVDGTPRQIIDPEATLNIKVTDLQHLVEETERKTVLKQELQQEVNIPFNLEQAPLIRCSLWQLSQTEYVLLITMHHIVSDGWSLGILNQEISTLYKAFLAGKSSPLEKLPVNYADFSVWEKQWLRGEILENQLNYWREQLQNAPELLQLPTDRPRPNIQTHKGKTQRFLLNTELTKKIQNLANESGKTLFMTLWAAFATLLYRYSGESDILIGSSIANRNRSEIESLIGFFVNTLVLRSNFQDNPSFLELLNQVKETTLKAYEHQDVLLEQVLPSHRSLSYSYLFQVMFILQPPVVELELPGITCHQLYQESAVSKFDLTVSITETFQGLEGEWEYKTDLWDDSTIKRMASHFENLLSAIVTHPYKTVNELQLLSETERDQLLVEWNKTQTAYPKDKCIHQLFEEQVKLTPNAIAVVFAEQQLTYFELNQKANQVARHLQSLGVKAESLVGICVERSLEMVIGVLGTLKAGGAYVPLDPNYPAERLSYMLTNSKVDVLLTQQDLLSSLPSTPAQIVCLDKDWELIEQYSTENLSTEVSSENLAYVIYTSGSTGQPKGVMIEHRSLVKAYWGWEKAYQLKSTTTCHLQLANFSFDVFTGDWVRALCSGAKLVLCSSEIRTDPAQLYSLMRYQKVDFAEFVPALIRPLVEYLEQTQQLLDFMQILIVGSDIWYMGEYRTLVNYCGSDSRVINSYGITECTIDSTFFEDEKNSIPEQALVPIGRPMSNTKIYILDQQLQPVPIGVIGELYIGGDGLARGYLNRPELTQEKFIANPFQTGERIYKTGDIARYLNDGNIEYLDRIDNQVKIRGFRIELGEIEAVINTHPQIQQTVVIAREEMPGNKRLVAYIVTEDELLNTNQIREYLKQKLPEYMLPSAFMFLKNLPLTPNGKIDRKALPAPDLDLSTQGELILPRDTIELKLAQIWSDLIGINPIGVTNNFFELGGHSLLAVSLMAQIQKKFHKKLSLATLFQNSTIEEIAHLLRLETDALDWSVLVPIKSKGNKPPLFCIHPSGGNVLCYQDLAYQLDLDQPVYGLQSFGLNPENQPHTSIEQMSSYYIQAIQTVQAHGPYLLMGWSLGGIVAFEMAQQLSRQGEQIAFLASVDANPLFTTSELENNDAVVMVWMLGEALEPCLEEIKQLEPQEQLIYVLEQAKQKNLVSEDVELTQIQHLLEINKLNIQALENYQPQSYLGSMIVIQASETNTDLGSVWNELVEKVDAYMIPGNHYNLVRNPQVQRLAQIFQKYLARS